jgi:hypothetical protein
MKRCPQCNSEYFDNMLDYCLEDGNRLIVVTKSLDQKTVERPAATLNNTTPAETVFIPLEKTPPNEVAPEIETVLKSDLHSQIQSKSEKLKTSVTDKWYQVLEFAPIILALAHNYWQWLYLSKQASLRLADFLFSYQFLIWFLLLISSAVFGIISLKYGRSKSFAVTALVILAINVLLSIVPK